jgi:hypothetical protein
MILPEFTVATRKALELQHVGLTCNPSSVGMAIFIISFILSPFLFPDYPGNRKKVPEGDKRHVQILRRQIAAQVPLK